MNTFSFSDPRLLEAFRLIAGAVLGAEHSLKFVLSDSPSSESLLIMLRAVLRHGARTGISKLSSTAAPISPLLLPATGIVTWHYAERLRRDPSADRTAASLAQTASQIYSQVRIMQETLFRFPVYGSPESLMFEDALGRQHLLPLAYVHNWEV